MLSFLKKWFCLMASCLLLCAVPAQAEEVPNTTVMIYMCGSNLESMNGAASSDIMEMLAAGYSKEDVQVVLMTGGAESWNGVGVNPSATAVYEITKRGGLRCRWDESLLNMGESDTLSFFLNYAAENYPAQRYALIMWDHGGGPLSGVCWDEIASDHLTLDEVTQALDASPFAHNPLEWIGFDACLMASAEVAWQMAPYARYMVASEETEPACGWNYSFLSGLEQDADGAATGKRIIESYMAGAQGDDTLTLSCIDLSKIDGLRASMSQYFDFLGQSLTEETFSRHSRMRSSTEAFGESILRAVTDTVTGDYDLVDLGHLLKQNTDDSWMQKEALEALESTVVANASTEEGHHGLSVYFPLKNKATYEKKWGEEYSELNFSDGYTGYVKKFGQILLEEALADWSQLDAHTELLGETDADGIRLTLQLTPEQQDSFASARLITLGLEEFVTRYRTYYSDEIQLNEDGTLTAEYHWETLHAVDDHDGHIMTPSLDFHITDEGAYALHAIARKSMETDSGDDVPLMLTYRRIPEDNRLIPESMYVWDEQTQTYSNRLSIRLEDYSYLFFTRTYRIENQTDVVTGFDSWPLTERIEAGYPVPTSEAFHLAFVSDPYDEPYVCFEITDTQNNTYLSSGWSRRTEAYNDFLVDNIVMEISSDALMMDESGIYLSLRTTNRYPRLRQDQQNRLYFFAPQVNGIPCTFDEGNYTLWETEPESINVKLLHLNWPEGITPANAESFCFRTLTCFYQDAAIAVGDDPISWDTTEYTVFEWDRSLSQNNRAVSMNSRYFSAENGIAFAKMDHVPNYAQEALDFALAGTAPQQLIVPLPEEVRGTKLGFGIVTNRISNGDGTTAEQPLWILPFDAETEHLRIPNGTLALQASQHTFPIHAYLFPNGKHGFADSAILYQLGENLGEILADGISFDLERMQITELDLSGSGFPLGMTEQVTFEIPSLEQEGEWLQFAAEMPLLPLKMAVTESLPEDCFLQFFYEAADGTTAFCPPVPLLPQVTQTQDPSTPAGPSFVPRIILNEMGTRMLAYGDFVLDTRDDCAVIAYLGNEESLVIPEIIGGFAIDRISIQHENPAVRQVTLPASLQIANAGSERYPDLYPRCGFSGFTQLETIIVPDECMLEEVPLKNFFLTTSNVPHRYGTATHVVRGGEELYFCGGFLYQLEADGSAVLVDAVSVYSDYFGEEQQRIPAAVNGHPVKRIAPRAFAYKSMFSNVVIENGIEEIGEEAFAGSNVQSVTLPVSIVSIGSSAFDLYDLQTVYVESSNAALIRSYFGGSNVNVLEAPVDSGVSGCFAYEISSAGEVTITGLQPEASVENGQLVIPAQIAGCPVRRIGDGAFKNADFKTLVIEEGVWEIGREAFYGNYDLTSVVLPATLRTIEESAFYCCFDLRELRLPDSLAYVAKDAFSGSGITRLYLNRFPDEMQFNAFYDVFNILVCPESLWAEIPGHFQNQELNRIVYAEGTEREGDGFTYVISGEQAAILSGRHSQERIVIPQKLDGFPVRMIAPHAFENCEAQEISLPEGLCFIGQGAFAGSRNLQAMILPDTVSTVGEEAFRDCTALQSIQLSSSMDTVPLSMLRSCSALQTVHIPDSIRFINDYAFEWCTALENIRLPEGVEEIDSFAFAYTGLKTVVLPASLQSIGSYCFSNTLEKAWLLSADTAVDEHAFDSATEVVIGSEPPEEDIVHDPETSALCGPSITWSLDENGTLKLTGSGPMNDFYTASTSQAWIEASDHPRPWENDIKLIRAVEIGHGITSIGKNAFNGCTGIAYVHFPDTLLRIGNDSFNGCSALKEVVLNKNLVSIGDRAFENCTALFRVELPEGLETIPRGAFAGCESLESISIPQSVRSIEGAAFMDCLSLQEMILPPQVEVLCDSVFYGCTSLKEITLPASLKVIEECAFQGCTGLTSIVVPYGTHTIEGFAFLGCTNVTLADFPASLTYIGHDLFAQEDLSDFTVFSNSPNYQYLKLIVDEGSPAHEYAELYGLHYEFR